METKTIGKKEVKLYTDIEEIPITRYSKFNKYMVLNEEVGHNFSDADAHFSKIYALINSPAKLKTQLDNFRQLVYSLDKEQNFLNMAYACLVYSIDGIKCDDLTVSGINETLSKLTELTAKDVKKKATISQIKRTKSLRNWIGIFLKTKAN